MPRRTSRRAPRLCRVGRGRDSKGETAVQSCVFSPGRMRRASARDSPCQTLEVGRQRVTGGRGVTLSLGVGSCPRGFAQSVHVSLSSTTDTAQAAHAQAQLHVAPSLTHSLTSSGEERSAVRCVTRHVCTELFAQKGVGPCKTHQRVVSRSFLCAPSAYLTQQDEFFKGLSRRCDLLCGGVALSQRAPCRDGATLQDPGISDWAAQRT